jgi:hypothetical protein
MITPFAFLFFQTWFLMRGVKFTKSYKGALTAVSTLIIEMIPLIDMLPGWTVSTIITSINSRQEDRADAVKKNPAKKKKDKKNSGKTSNKKPGGAATDVSQKPTVGSEVKPASESTKQKQASKEIEASQTSGAKTSNEKLINASSEAPKAQSKTDNQADKNKNQEGEKKDKEKTEPGKPEEDNKKDEENKKKPNELYDTRTNRYTKQQGKADTEGDEGAFEDLPLKKEGDYNPTPNEAEGGQDKQEFSLGDPYREPVDITPQKPMEDKKKNPDEDNDLRMAA